MVLKLSKLLKEEFYWCFHIYPIDFSLTCLLLFNWHSLSCSCFDYRMCLNHLFFICLCWAPSSEFVSSSIPSWQISTAHAQPFRGARDLAFCLKVPLDSLLVWASSKGSGETARMRRLAWTFAARICGKYQIRLTRSMLYSAHNEIFLRIYYLLGCFMDPSPYIWFHKRLYQILPRKISQISWYFMREYYPD